MTSKAGKYGILRFDGIWDCNVRCIRSMLFCVLCRLLRTITKKHRQVRQSGLSCRVLRIVDHGHLLTWRRCVEVDRSGAGDGNAVAVVQLRQLLVDAS